MKQTEISRRYARALFLAIAEQKSVAPQEFLKQLQELASWVGADANLRNTLQHALLSSAKKKQALERYAIGRNAKLHALVWNLLDLLFARKRMNMLADLALQLEREIQESQNVVQAFVQSSVELSEDSKKNIILRLSKVLGKKVVIETSVRPELLAGLRIQAGDMIIDNSMRTKLQNLMSQFKQA